MPATTSTRKKLPPIKVENATIIYKNFAGRARQFNAAGLRNFHVVLDNDLARTLAADGWNIRWHEPKTEDQEKWASLKVAVRFDNYPPRVVLVSADHKVKTNLTADTVSLLDDAELVNVDLVITPSQWTRADGSGIKAYLKTMFAVLSPNDLEAKYMRNENQTPEEDGN